MTSEQRTPVSVTKNGKNLPSTVVFTSINFSELSFSSNVAWACCLVPNALPRIDLSKLLKSLEEKMAVESRNSYYLSTLWALTYRARYPAEAVKLLRDSIKENSNGGLVEDWLYLTMAEQAKRPDEAKKALDEARKLLAARKPDNWQEQVGWQILRDEAETLVRSGK
jgi:tetratricopeptide (TPR) repeat protein